MCRFHRKSIILLKAGGTRMKLGSSNESLTSSGSRRKRASLFLAGSIAWGTLASGLFPANIASALSYIPASNGIVWQIHDAAPPGLDTGSIRTASQSSIQGFGDIFVRVSAKPEPLFNGEMMRGFGIEFDGADTFATTRAVNLGGVQITREIKIASDGSWSIEPSRPTRANVSRPLAAVGASREMTCWSAK